MPKVKKNEFFEQFIQIDRGHNLRVLRHSETQKSGRNLLDQNEPLDLPPLKHLRATLTKSGTEVELL